MNIALENTADIDNSYQQMVEHRELVLQYYTGVYTLFNEKKEIFDDDYEPILNAEESISTRLYQFMKEHDPYDYMDQSSGNEEEDLNEVKAMLHDTNALTDTIKYLNLIIDENEDVEEKGTAIMLREEVSMMFSLQRCV